MTDPNQPPQQSYPPPQQNYAPSQPYVAPSAYGQAPGGGTNTLAIVALILGFVVPIAGIITGHIALRQIRRTGEQGHGLALAGTILGYVFTVLGILAIVAYFVFLAVIIGSAGAAVGGLSPSDFAT